MKSNLTNLLFICNIVVFIINDISVHFIIFLNSCTLIIFNQIHYSSLPHRNNLSSISVTWNGERVRPVLMRVWLSVHRLSENHIQICLYFVLQHPTSNDPINSRRTKSSPGLHFFFFSNFRSRFPQMSQQGKNDNLNFVSCRLSETK